MLTLSPDEKLDFSDVLLLPRVSDHLSIRSRSEIDLERDGAVPLIVANMDTIGTFDFAQHLLPYRIQVALLKDFDVETWRREVEIKNLDPRLLIPTMGTRDIEAEVSKIKQLLSHFPTIKMVCLDVANGYLPSVAYAVRKIRDALPSSVKICAGNVVEESGMIHLANAGANVIKIGIGSGGVCLTRRMTGVGFPQFSAVQELSKLARELNVEIISDGGITSPGDMAKAYAAGADYVMSGSYFAGHEETGQRFHGMSSDRSRTDRKEHLEDYRASEGREVVLHNKGSIAHTIRGVLGGLRSACTYLGVEKLEDLKDANLKAIRVHHQINPISGVKSETN